jgi:hypothetical protein
LAIGRLHLNLPDHLSTGHHMSKRGKTLAIRVSVTPKIKRRLIANTKKETRRGCIGSAPRHRNRSVNVT